MPSKGNLKYCYVCAKDVGNGTNFNMHMEKHAAHLRLSNRTSDYNKTACKVCGKKIALGVMRNHTKVFHQMTITEYKENFQQHYYTVDEPIFHRCGLCKVIVLLDSDSIAMHLRNNSGTHGLTHSEYNQKFLNLAYAAHKTKKNTESKEIKKIDPGKPTSESANAPVKSAHNKPVRAKEIQKQVISNRGCEQESFSEDSQSGGMMRESKTQPQGNENDRRTGDVFDINSFREFLRFLGNNDGEPRYSAIETLLTMDV